MTVGGWDVQVLRDLRISTADEFVSLDAQVGNRIVAEWRARPGIGDGALVHRLRAALRAQQAKDATSLLERERLYGESLIARLAGAMPEMIADGEPHPAAVLAMSRGITTPSAVRGFVRAWIAEHEQQPGAAYELPDSAYWRSVVNLERGVAA